MHSSDVENVLAATDIASLIGRYISLKKAGTNYKALCPFHNEDTPSFVVNPNKQIYHCFGCGKGGDAISFLTQYEKMPFIEALETLANEGGVILEKTNTKSREKQKKELEKRDSIYRINSEAMLFYNACLSRSEKGLLYLRGRGVSDDTKNSFMLGYAPKSWDGLLRHLNKKGYTETQIIQAGLAVKSEKAEGRVYDRFRDRAMFPIINNRDNVIGFGGRLIDGEGPKYINSPETEAFDKKSNLFGLNFAKQAIVKSEYAVITEGYLDVIAAHQAGIKNVVAPLGTALTGSQIKLLCRYTDCVVIVFDSDSAGIKAVYRAFENISGHKIKAKVMLLPPGHDPDSYINEFGGSVFVDGLNKALSIVEFLLRNIISTSELSSIDGEIACVERAISILHRIEDPLLLSRYIAHFSEISKISKPAIEEAISRKKTAQKKSPRTVKEKPKQENEESGKKDKAKIYIIKEMIKNPRGMQGYISALGDEDFCQGYQREIFSTLKRKIEEGQTSFNGSISSLFTNEECISFVSSVFIGDNDKETDPYHIEQCINVLKRGQVERKVEYLQEMIRDTATRGGTMDREVIEEYTKLLRSLKCPVKNLEG